MNTAEDPTTRAAFEPVRLEIVDEPKPTPRDLARKYAVKRLTTRPWFSVKKEGSPALIVAAWWHEGDVVVKHPNPVVVLAVKIFERNRVARTQFGDWTP